MNSNDVNTPLHLLQPEYDTPYAIPSKKGISLLLDRILSFLEKATPAHLVNKTNNKIIDSLSDIDENSKFAEGDFRLTSYEWGVTYAGMLRAAEATGNNRFKEYTVSRLQMIAELFLFHKKNPLINVDNASPVHSVLKPHALDDAGALCAAMIKVEQAGLNMGLRPLIDNFIDYISAKELRLSDGTFARNRPYPNTLWLDDLFMSVPALGQMAKFGGNHIYFDDAVKQVLQFSERMFIKEKGIYMHGWAEQMQVHPQFCWARANGWAVMAMLELLTVLPENHSGYTAVLEQFRLHTRGLALFQSGRGFWHQLLDRQDSYHETSATAIITYAIARAVNNGYIDKYVFGPLAVLGWNAVASKINAMGQVEGTCVGTGMGFDPAFYYYRPVNVFAAHGYGPALLAGAEVIGLIGKESFYLNECSIQIKV